MKSAIMKFLFFISGKFLPGLNFLLLGRPGWFFAMWGGIYATLFGMWIAMAMLGGSRVLAWGYLVTLLAISTWCGFYKPADGEEPRFRGRGGMIFGAIACLFGSVLLLDSRHVGIQYRIASASMEPTLRIGEVVMADPFSYKWFGKPIARGDLAIHRSPTQGNTLFIHRVLGIPGDTVMIKAGDPYLNGKLLASPYRHQSTVYSDSKLAGLPAYLDACDRGQVPREYCDYLRREKRMLQDSVIWVLPPERYFLAGDNFDNSADSRMYGLLQAGHHGQSRVFRIRAQHLR